MIKSIIPFYNSSDKLIVKSRDCNLYDSEGKKYIDFESGVWCANIGHSNKQVVKRMNRQIKKQIHHGYHFRNKYAEKLSVKLQQLIGFENGASVFLSSGSEAVNLSITLAWYFTGKKFMQSPFRYAQSHQNDPLGCSVALEVIKVIEANHLIERSGTTGDYFKKQLDRIIINSLYNINHYCFK